MFNKSLFIITFEARILENSTLCNVPCHYQLIYIKCFSGDLQLDVVVSGSWDHVLMSWRAKSIQSGVAICDRKCLFPQPQRQKLFGGGGAQDSY